VRGEPFGGLALATLSCESRSDEGSLVEDSATYKEGAKSLAGTKRLRLEAFNAVRKGEITNSVDYAFLQRPCSPKNYRIYSDK